MMTPMSAPRVAAGALFRDDRGRFMLVKPTYKAGWDIPGGYVEPGETPAAACEREVGEELGLQKRAGALLVVDWAPSESEGDKVLFVFDGGQLTRTEIEKVQLQADEIAAVQFYEPAEFATVLPDRLVRRLSAAVEAHRRASPLYLEHGLSRDGGGGPQSQNGARSVAYESSSPRLVGRPPTPGRGRA